jgi:hypothetical protein
MSALRRWLHAALALLVCLSALGCGNSAEQVGGDGPARQSDAATATLAEDRERGGGVPGAPLNRGSDARAIGAPIRVPAVVERQGDPLDEVRADIERKIRNQCGGGELCVNLRVEPRDDGFKSCQFVRTDPEAGTEVARGGTIVIVSGTQSCTDGTGTGGGGEPLDDAGENGEPSEGDTSQPPTSDP